RPPRPARRPDAGGGARPPAAGQGLRAAHGSRGGLAFARGRALGPSPQPAGAVARRGGDPVPRPATGLNAPASAAQPPPSTLERGMGLSQALATNIVTMVGIGPFLTIPFMVVAMDGPHIIYAWVAGAVLALADGLVYAHLGAALPGCGGPYLYLREAYQPLRMGRLMAFTYIFQIILVAPLSIAGA